MSEKYHLAEINIARMQGAIDSPVMAEFAAQLETVNALAENSPGFVWRLKTSSGDATSIRAFEDEFIIVNLSVWTDVESLFQYVYYNNDHATAYRRRADWFEKMDMPSFVMWWIPVGHVPTLEEAKAKLEYLHEHGPTLEAFTFKKRFEAPEH
jgi:hypothetical protein